LIREKGFDISGVRIIPGIFNLLRLVAGSTLDQPQARLVPDRDEVASARDRT